MNTAAPGTSRVRLLQPGTWIQAPIEEAHGVGLLFNELTNHLLDADLALELFDQTMAVSRAPPRAALEGASARQWRRNGRMPFMYAREFVFALDLFERTLCALHNRSTKPALSACYDDFLSKFPGLKGVRDSAHHRYERVQGKGRRNNRDKVINPKAIHTLSIKAPDGAVMLIGNLHGSEFTFTDPNGEHAKVDITLASLNLVAEVMQGVFDCFTWTGSRQEIEL